MEENTMKRILASIICIAIVAFVSCSYENTATVTIDTGIRQQAQLDWFDRVLVMVGLVTPVQADPVPDPLYSSITSIIVTVTATDMETITRQIPLDTGKITLDIPAGSQRTFEVVGYDESGNRYYGGIATVDLAPGQQVNLNIEMGQLAYTSPTFNYMSNNVEIIYYKNNNISAPIFFKVYHNIGVAQPIYELIDTVAVSSLGYDEDNYSITYHYSNSEINSDNRMLYYISALNKYGEGEKVQIY